MRTYAVFATTPPSRLEYDRESDTYTIYDPSDTQIAAVSGADMPNDPASAQRFVQDLIRQAIDAGRYRAKTVPACEWDDARWEAFYRHARELVRGRDGERRLTAQEAETGIRRLIARLGSEVSQIAESTSGPNGGAWSHLAFKLGCAVCELDH